MYQQLWRYKVEEKLYLGVREQKRFNTTGLDRAGDRPVPSASSSRYQSDTGLLPFMSSCAVYTIIVVKPRCLHLTPAGRVLNGNQSTTPGVRVCLEKLIVAYLAKKLIVRFFPSATRIQRTASYLIWRCILILYFLIRLTVANYLFPLSFLIIFMYALAVSSNNAVFLPIS
jgi:hypothetical protein